MKYREAYDKIIEAYFKDEIQPLSAAFCFCGTLSPDENWYSSGCEWNNVKYPYKSYEYGLMERALFSPFPEILWLDVADLEYDVDLLLDKRMIKNYEEKLFKGMCAALEVLREIHISRGEIIDEGIKLSKRKLSAHEERMDYEDRQEQILEGAREDFILNWREGK